LVNVPLHESLNVKGVGQSLGQTVIG